MSWLVPSPASLKLTASAPVLLSMLAEALPMKWGLVGQIRLSRDSSAGRKGAGRLGEVRGGRSQESSMGESPSERVACDSSQRVLAPRAQSGPAGVRGRACQLRGGLRPSIWGSRAPCFGRRVCLLCPQDDQERARGATGDDTRRQALGGPPEWGWAKGEHVMCWSCCECCGLKGQRRCRV